MTVVYAWPPVGHAATEWTAIDPVSVSRSLLTGKRYASAAQPRRRVTQLTVNALTNTTTSGAGYMEALKRLLAGGEHCVRLYSYPINRHADAALENLRRQSTLRTPTTSGTDADLTATATAADLFSGNVLTVETIGVDFAGFYTLTISGFDPGALAVRPAEFLTVYENNADSTGTTVQAVNEATADETGEATIRIFGSMPHYGRACIGTRETAIFEAVGPLPRSQQPAGGQWSYTWNFREVFPDEIGSFTEYDPW